MLSVFGSSWRAELKRSDKTLEECTPFTSFEAIVVSEPGARLTGKSLSAFATDVCGHHDQTTWLATLHWPGTVLWIGRTDGEGFEYGLVDPNAADPHFLPMKRSSSRGCDRPDCLASGDAAPSLAQFFE